MRDTITMSNPISGNTGDDAPLTSPLVQSPNIKKRRGTSDSNKQGSSSSIFSRFSIMGSNAALDAGFDPMKVNCCCCSSAVR